MTSIAVIVPLFNKRAYVAACIASLVLQSRRPDELIIVDDASTDGSAEIVEHVLAQHAQRLRAHAWTYCGCRITLAPARHGMPGLNAALPIWCSASTPTTACAPMRCR